MTTLDGNLLSYLDLDGESKGTDTNQLWITVGSILYCYGFPGSTSRTRASRKARTLTFLQFDQWYDKTYWGLPL